MREVEQRLGNIARIGAGLLSEVIGIGTYQRTKLDVEHAGGTTTQKIIIPVGAGVLEVTAPLSIRELESRPPADPNFRITKSYIFMYIDMGIDAGAVLLAYKMGLEAAIAAKIAYNAAIHVFAKPLGLERTEITPSGEHSI